MSDLLIDKKAVLVMNTWKWFIASYNSDFFTQIMITS